MATCQSSGRKEEHMKKRILYSSLLILAGAIALQPLCVAQSAQNVPASTCIDCHSALDKPFQVTAEQYADDVHAQKGLTCASCHGGDPTSPDNAMDRKKGFRGHVPTSWYGTDLQAIPSSPSGMSVKKAGSIMLYRRRSKETLNSKNILLSSWARRKRRTIMS